MSKRPTTKKVNKQRMSLLWGIVLTIAGASFYSNNHVWGGICFCVGIFLLVISFRRRGNK